MWSSVGYLHYTDWHRICRRSVFQSYLMPFLFFFLNENYLGSLNCRMTVKKNSALSPAYWQEDAKVSSEVIITLDTTAGLKQISGMYKQCYQI